MRLQAIAFAFALLLLLSGCIDSLSPDERLLCLDLTNKSYAFVPECADEKDCFSKLDKAFFSFDHSALSSRLQSELYSYKNDVALSWLYFNKAKGSIKEISGICARNTGLSGILFHLNELTHSMAKAFEFSEKASKESFAILLLEHADLEKQGVMLAKEEPLFRDYAVITGNLNDLSSENCSADKSYACFYRSKAQAFESAARKTGFEDRVLSEASVFDFLDSHSAELSEYAESSLEIPLIGQVLQPLLAFLSGFFTASSAISGLERASAFEFMQAYNGFMGTDNSCLKGFSAIIREDALHRTELIQRNKALEENAEHGLEAARQSIAMLLSENYASFDQNFFQRLYAGLGQDSEISAQKYGIRDFGELRQQAELELEGFRQRLWRIKQLDSLHELGLGEKASSLKELNLEIALLQENLEYLESEVIDGLLVLCDERALFIERSLDGAELPQDFLLDAADLKARAKFRLAQFRNASGKEQELLQCSEMVEEFDRFSNAMQGFEEYRLQEHAMLDGCFSFLEAALKSNGAAGIDLSDFLFRFHELQAIEKPYYDIASVQKICLSLKEDLLSFLQRQESVKRVEENFSFAESLFSSLESTANQSSALSDSELEKLGSELQGFRKFFQGGTMLWEKALPVLPELDSGLGEFVSLLQEKLESSSAGLVEKTETLELVSAASSEAVFSKKVSLECRNLVPRLLVKTVLLDANGLSFQNIFVSHGQKSPAFSVRESEISFFVEGCFEKTEANVFFSVAGPVETSYVLAEESLEESLKKSTYAVSFRNRLPFELSPFQAILKPGFLEGASGIELLDLSGKKLKFFSLPDGSISFAFPALLPMQEKQVALLSFFSDANQSLPTAVLEGPEELFFPDENAFSGKLAELDSTILSASEKLAMLDQIFSAASDEELVSAKYVPPISRTELDKLRLRLSKLSSLSSSSSLSQSPEQLEESINEAADIDARLESALNAVKEDAVAAYNSSVELFNLNPGSEDARKSLEQAGEALLKGNYLSSIVLSKNASAMAVLSKQQGIDLPLFALPVLACSALLLFVRFKKKKIARQRKEILKRIERSWPKSLL